MNSLQNIKKQISKNRDQKQNLITELQNRLKGQEQMTKILTDRLAQQKNNHLEYKISELYKLGYVYKQCSSGNESNPRKYLIIDISTLKDEDDFVINNQVNFAKKKQIDRLLQISNLGQPNGVVDHQSANSSGKMLDKQINSLRTMVSQLRNEMNSLKKQYQQNFHYNRINVKENGSEKYQKVQINSQILSPPPSLLKQSSKEQSPKYYNNLSQNLQNQSKSNNSLIKLQNGKTQPENKIQSLTKQEDKTQHLNMKQMIIEQLNEIKETATSPLEQKIVPVKEQIKLNGENVKDSSSLSPTQNLRVELIEANDSVPFKSNISQIPQNCSNNGIIVQVPVNQIDNLKSRVQIDSKTQDNKKQNIPFQPDKQILMVYENKQLPKQIQLRNSETQPIVKQSPQKQSELLIKSEIQIKQVKKEKQQTNEKQKLNPLISDPIPTQKQHKSDNIIPISEQIQYQIKILPIALDFSMNIGKSNNEQKQAQSNEITTLSNINHNQQNPSSSQFISKSSHSSVLEKSGENDPVQQKQLKTSIQQKGQLQKQQQKIQHEDKTIINNISEKNNQDTKIESTIIKQKEPQQKKEFKQQISAKNQGSNTKLNPHKKKTDSKADKKGSQLNWGSLFSSHSSNKKSEKNKQRQKEHENSIKKFVTVQQKQPQGKIEEKEQKPVFEEIVIKNTTQAKIIPHKVQKQSQPKLKQREDIQTKITTEQIQNKTSSEIRGPIQVKKQKINSQLSQKQRTQITIEPTNIQSVNTVVNVNQNKKEQKQLTDNPTPVILHESQPKITKQNQNTDTPLPQNDSNKQTIISQQKDKASHQKTQKKEIHKQEDKQKHKQLKKKADGHKQQLNWGSLFSNFGQSNSKPNKQKSDKKHEKAIKKIPNAKEKQQQKEKQKIQKEMVKPAEIQKQKNLIIQSPQKRQQKQEVIFTTPPRKQEESKIDDQSKSKSEQKTPTWNQVNQNEQQEQSKNKQVQVIKSAEVKANQYESEQKKENKVLSEQEIRIQKQKQRKKAQLEEQQELDKLLLELQMNQNNLKPISFSQKAQQIQKMSEKKDEVLNKEYSGQALKNIIEKQQKRQPEVKSSKQIKPIQVRKLSQQLKLNRNIQIKSQTVEYLKAQQASQIPHTPHTPYPPPLEQMQPFKKDSLFYKKQTKHQHLRKAHSLIQPHHQTQYRKQQDKNEKILTNNESPIQVSISGSNSSPNASPNKVTPVVKKVSSQNDNFLVISAEYSEKSDKNTVKIVPMKSQQLYKIQSKNQNEIQQNSSIHPAQKTQITIQTKVKQNPSIVTPQKKQNQQKAQKNENKQIHKVQQEIKSQRAQKPEHHKTTDKKRNKVIFLRK